MRPTGEWLNQPGGLTERLARLRAAAGLTQTALAERLGWIRTKVVKLENGRQMPADADVTAWAQATGQLQAAPELLALLAEARSVHRQYRHQIRRGGHAAVQRDLDRLVRQAKRIRNFEALIIPGLLQTPEYARYRLREVMDLSGDPDDPVRAVGARMRRQEVLYESGREYEFIIMETALLTRSCPAEVMLGQLDRLISASGLPSVTLAVIPLAAELVLTPVVASFLILDDTTYIETYSAEDLLYGRESETYSRVADALAAEAVTGEAGRDLITAASRRFREFAERESQPEIK